MVRTSPTVPPASTRIIRTKTLLLASAILLLGIFIARNTLQQDDFASHPSLLKEEAHKTVTPAAATTAGLSRMLNPVKSLFGNYWSKSVTTATGSSSSSATSVAKEIPASLNGSRISKTMAKRTPVYFVSHGGPNTMYEDKHPVFAQLQGIGREITQKVKPAAIVVFSAHWQAQRPNTIEVNVSEQEPLLYDFYGFPRHYYAEKFPNKGSPELAKKIMGVLKDSGIRTEEAERGLDHGVFVPFKVMFDPKDNPVTVPIVQVSLFDNDTDAEAHIRLGRAVQKLREENVLILCSGMSIHNLRHLMMGAGGKKLPYAFNFDQAIKDAAETKPGEHRDEVMVDLLKHSDARQAHPTFEHLLPIHIAVGASGEDQGKQLWTLVEGPMAWAQYRFGEVDAAA